MLMPITTTNGLSVIGQGRNTALQNDLYNTSQRTHPKRRRNLFRPVYGHRPHIKVSWVTETSKHIRPALMQIVRIECPKGVQEGDLGSIQITRGFWRLSSCSSSDKLAAVTTLQDKTQETRHLTTAVELGVATPERQGFK